MRTTAEINHHITRTAKAIAQLRADRTKHSELLTLARSRREQSALAALTSKDVKTQDQLLKLRSDQRSLELEAEDLDLALQQATQQLSRYEAEREEAQREECWQELLKLHGVAVDQATLIDGSLVALDGVLAKHTATLKKMTELARRSGRPRIYDLRHFWRFLSARLRPHSPALFWKQPALYQRQYYAELLADVTSIDSNEERKAS